MVDKNGPVRYIQSYRSKRERDGAFPFIQQQSGI